MFIVHIEAQTVQELITALDSHLYNFIGARKSPEIVPDGTNPEAEKEAEPKAPAKKKKKGKRVLPKAQTEAVAGQAAQEESGNGNGRVVELNELMKAVNKFAKADTDKNPDIVRGFLHEREVTKVSDLSEKGRIELMALVEEGA